MKYWSNEFEIGNLKLETGRYIDSVFVFRVSSFQFRVSLGSRDNVSLKIEKSQFKSIIFNAIHNHTQSEMPLGSDHGTLG